MNQSVFEKISCKKRKQLAFPKKNIGLEPLLTNEPEVFSQLNTGKCLKLLVLTCLNQFSRDLTHVCHIRIAEWMITLGLILVITVKCMYILEDTYKY